MNFSLTDTKLTNRRKPILVSLCTLENSTDKRLKEFVIEVHIPRWARKGREAWGFWQWWGFVGELGEELVESMSWFLYR